jgi:hypothetical protein
MIVVVTHVDNKTGISVAQMPPRNGPRLPDLPSLELLWSKTSQYPTNVPEFVCRVAAGDYSGVSGVLNIITEEEATELHQVELQARVDKEQQTIIAPIIEQRNKLLEESDKYMLEDFPMTSEKGLEWKTYRQALRDLPAQSEFPYTVEWPVAP